MNKEQFETVAKALLINDSNEALILTIGEYKEKPERSFTPDLPGGLVDPGESEMSGVIREIYEETGIKVEPNSLTLGYTGTQFSLKDNKSVSKLLYLAHLKETPEVKISWEHASYEWKPLSTLMATTKFRSFYEEALNYCIEKNLLL